MYTIETIEKQYFLFFIFFFNFSHLSLIDLVNLLQLTLLTYLSFRLTQLTTYNIFYTHPRFLNLSDGSSDHGQRLTLFSFVCALNSCILFYRSPPAEPSPSPSPPYKSSRSFLPPRPPPFPPPPPPPQNFHYFHDFHNLHYYPWPVEEIIRQQTTIYRKKAIRYCMEWKMTQKSGPLAVDEHAD